MKHAFTTCLLFIMVMSGYGQQTSFDLNRIKFNGVSFLASKEIVVKTFGKPKVNYPDYECGAHSREQPGSSFYQLLYQGFNYIGRDKEKFQLEEVNFDVKGKTKLKYGDTDLSGLTTKNDMIKLFGNEAKEQFDKKPVDELFFFSSHRDDGATFYFKNGKLIKFEYWSPC